MFSPAALDGPGKPLWEFVSDVVCEDLCQPNDLPVVLYEQKSILIQALSVLQALYRCQDLWCSRNDTSKFPNISTVPTDSTLLSLFGLISQVDFYPSYNLNLFVPPHPGLSLIGSVFRVCQHQSESKREHSNKDKAKDDQLMSVSLAEITSEFLADICLNITKVISQTN